MDKKEAGFEENISSGQKGGCIFDSDLMVGYFILSL